MIEASIVNVVATAALGQRVDLDELGRCPQIIHDSNIYRGRVAYFRSPKFAGEVTIFTSGKMISVGSKSEAEAFRALDFAKEYLMEKGFVKQAILLKKTQNIVVVVNFGHEVDLEELAQDHKMVYEPEQFAGGILRMEECSGVTALVYSSGKAVIAGIKSHKDIERIVERLGDCCQVLRLTSFERERFRFWQLGVGFPIHGNYHGIRLRFFGSVRSNP
jgi:TATA-box binding protein (TBP) (component of TFIID and TFIIIB)